MTSREYFPNIFSYSGFKVNYLTSPLMTRYHPFPAIQTWKYSETNIKRFHTNPVKESSKLIIYLLHKINTDNWSLFSFNILKIVVLLLITLKLFLNYRSLHYFTCLSYIGGLPRKNLLWRVCVEGYYLPPFNTWILWSS